MKTTKSCSTISYNTSDFLELKLNELTARRVISFWLYMEHLPEEDESKAHKHLFIIPNGQLNTDQVQDYLQELDPANIAKPLGCIFFVSSKFDDFYFYCLHDLEYLASKGQTRKYSYKPEEFKTSDSDYFTALKHQIDYTKLGNRKTVQIVKEIESGASLESLLQRGLIPASLFNQWRSIYDMMYYAPSTFRNGRQTHSPVGRDECVNMETGEVEFDPDLHLQFEIAHLEKKAQASKPKGTK